MSPRLTLETSLILACMRRAPDAGHIQDLVKRGPDWHLILRAAERWRLAPLVYTSLQQIDPTGHVPDPVADRLRHLYHRETVHWIDRREVLREALGWLSEANVPVIVMKGAVLATLVYPSPALRPTRTVDLLVRRRDAARVEALLKSRGEVIRLRSSPLDIRTHILRLDRPPHQLPAADIPIEKFWERARPARLESEPALVFSPEDLLLHIAIDLAFGGFVGHARTLCDIGQTCGRYGDTIDWSQLI